MRWYVVRRLAWTVLALYLFVSVTFFVFALTPDPNQRLAGMGAAIAAAEQGQDPNEAAREAMETYAEARDRDRPLLDRYLGWVVGYATLDWGVSQTYRRHVTDVILGSLPVTLAYLLPAIVLSSALGVLAGVYGALSRGGLVDRVGRGVAYLGLGIPAFFLADFVPTLLTEHGGSSSGPMGSTTLHHIPSIGSYDPATLALPAAIVGLNLYAVQAWAVRAEAIELAPAEFVKTLRANGATGGRLARHVVKNAASPIMALFVSEVLVVLFVTIYVVEIVLGIHGIAYVTFAAFENRDIGLIIGTLLLPTIVALLGSLASDLAAASIDPRIADGSGRE